MDILSYDNMLIIEQSLAKYKAELLSTIADIVREAKNIGFDSRTEDTIAELSYLTDKKINQIESARSKIGVMMAEMLCKKQ